MSTEATPSRFSRLRGSPRRTLAAVLVAVVVVGILLLGIHWSAEPDPFDIRVNTAIIDLRNLLAQG